jgi:predicted glycosyltransferase
VLGNANINQLEKQFGTTPLECGYVARLSELDKQLGKRTKNYKEPLAGTVSIPWLGESTFDFIVELSKAIRLLGSSHGKWRIFIGTEKRFNNDNKIHSLFQNLDYCLIEPPGSRYNEALNNSKCALIYGGYNSLMDVLYTEKPCVVMVRDMQDQEQDIHLKQLLMKTGNQLLIFHENGLNHQELFNALKKQMFNSEYQDNNINLNGAAIASGHLVRLLDQ